MKHSETIKTLSEQRYSVRHFLPQEVEDDKINYILQCGRLAPSAVNYQPWMFYVVRDKAVQAQLHRSYNREWFRTAPIYIVVCKDSSESWKRSGSDHKDHGDIDAAIAATHLSLAVNELGLGTCWVCNFDPVLLREALRVTDTPQIEPVVIFPIGYIDQEQSKVPEKKRKELTEIVKVL